MTQVVINDSNLYDLIEKGEIVKNYFNPGNLFSRIVFLNLFREKKIRQRVPGIGQASTQILSFSIHPLIKVCTTSYFPELAQIFVFLIFRKHKTVFYDPELKLIRNFGHGLSLIIGGEIKKITGVPLITSLHGNPDVDYLRGRRSLGNPLFRMVGERQKKTEKRSLQHADFVMGVYSPIRPYLQKNLPARFVIVPNLLSKKMPLKKTYQQKRNFRIINVGRQDSNQKNPIIILEALKRLPHVHATLVGNGDLHQKTVEFVKENKLTERVRLILRCPNKKIISQLGKYDLFVYHSLNWEVSKGCMEAALCGLPVLVNQRPGGLAQEVRQAGFYVVKNSPQGFAHGIEKLAANWRMRRSLGRKNLRYAQKNWDPQIVEARQAEITKRVLR